MRSAAWTLFVVWATLVTSCSTTDRRATGQELESSAETPECSLSEAALGDRLEQIGALFRAHCRQVEELPDGFAFRYEGGTTVHAQVTDIARKEEACCPFLTWEIEEPEGGSFWVRLTGAKEFVRDHLVLLHE